MAMRRPKSRRGAAQAQPGSGEPCVTGREKYLRQECATLSEHIDLYTQRMKDFEGQNEGLDKEAREIRENNKAYLSYLAKRTLRCQDAIITLNDQNRSELTQVLKQKEELTSQYTDKEKEVRSQLIEMETKYSLMNKEVEELKPFKELQAEQLARIRELERELLAMKIHHSEQMHLVKSRFLQQKAEYEAESQQKVQALAKRAEKEAVRSLIQHTKQIKAENRQLRDELLSLIKRAHGLDAIVRQLREQRAQLLREMRYCQGLADKRRWLTQKGQGPRGRLGQNGAVLPPANKEPAPPPPPPPTVVPASPRTATESLLLAGRVPRPPSGLSVRPSRSPPAEEEQQE
ncbi:coiled-coil domain-containing protein 166 [Anolis carolinensis]|uniref:coiled-coil domain-containing protein 166 n=1 Tax=Anolis carolinensis TaxID=28377 RepID=UPI002F2B6191